VLIDPYPGRSPSGVSVPASGDLHIDERAAPKGAAHCVQPNTAFAGGVRESVGQASAGATRRGPAMRIVGAEPEREQWWQAHDIL